MVGRITSPTKSRVIYRRREFDACRYTPEQNGMTKRKNRTIEEAAREILEEKIMPKFYSTEAVRKTVYL